MTTSIVNMSVPMTQWIDMLHSHLPELTERHPLKSLGIFGSYIHNQQTPASDLDILVEFEKPISLFSFVAVEQELSDLLGVPVDLVMKESLKPHIGQIILNEVIPIWPINAS